jgi:hypothetical protein
MLHPRQGVEEGEHNLLQRGVVMSRREGSWLLEPAEVPGQATESQNNSKTASLEHAVRCQPGDVSGAPQCCGSAGQDSFLPSRHRTPHSLSLLAFLTQGAGTLMKVLCHILLVYHYIV